IYAAWLDGATGASERTIGEWIRDRGVRDSVVLGTKGAHPPMDAKPKVGRCAREQIDQHLNESLERLGLERVDLYWLHFDEPDRPVGEIIESLAEFKEDGRIRSYGASNWKGERIAAANDFARQHGLPPFVATQPFWNLASDSPDTVPDPETLFGDDAAGRREAANIIAHVPYSSQANGFFGAPNVEWAEGGFEGTAPTAEKYDSPRNRQRLLRAIELAEKKGASANQIGLACLISHPFPVFPIIGTSNPAHVREALGAPEVELAPEECAYLIG
ncbi:MAG: aldo/keto reductase, partial [Planctomycetota bacterium]